VETVPANSSLDKTQKKKEIRTVSDLESMLPRTINTQNMPGN
jgi:hypothetical protein